MLKAMPKAENPEPFCLRSSSSSSSSSSSGSMTGMDARELRSAVYRYRKVLLPVVALLLLVLSLNLRCSDPMPVDTSTRDPYILKYWFFSLKADSYAYVFCAKMAVLSALRRTSLQPVMILYGRNRELEEWMLHRKVLISYIGGNRPLPDIIQYIEGVPAVFSDGVLGMGAWLRLVIPQILKELHAEDKIGAAEMKRADYVLYTDVDILFMRDFELERRLLPRWLSFAVQGNFWCCHPKKFDRQAHVNDGVLVMNVTGYTEALPLLSQFIRREGERGHKGPYLDQAVLGDFFPQRLRVLGPLDLLQLLLFNFKYFKGYVAATHYSDTLPKRFNWEPYLGRSDEAVVIHWHGPKLYFRECAGSNLTFTPPSAGRRETVSLSHAKDLWAAVDPSNIVAILNENSFEQDSDNAFAAPAANHLDNSKRYHYLLSTTPNSVRGYDFYLREYFHYYKIICLPR